MDDCCSLVKAIRHEVGELSAKLNIMIQTMGKEPVPAPGGIKFTRVKMPEPRHYGSTRDAKEVENFLFNMEHYFRAM